MRLTAAPADQFGINFSLTYTNLATGYSWSTSYSLPVALATAFAPLRNAVKVAYDPMVGNDADPVEIALQCRTITAWALTAAAIGAILMFMAVDPEAVAASAIAAARTGRLGAGLAAAGAAVAAAAKWMCNN